MTLRLLNSGQFAIFLLLVWTILVSGFCPAEETNLVCHSDSALLVSPLIGWDKNVLNTGQTDTSPEYGVFAMYASPQVVVNNTYFYTRVNSCSARGDITSLSLYGDPDDNLTWFLGGSYTWHQIDNDTVKLLINEPLYKVGGVWRIPSLHLSVNPYVGYGQEIVHTSISTPHYSASFRDSTDLGIYGLSVYWHWRNYDVNAKYYIANELERNVNLGTFRVFATMLLSEHVAFMSRFEYTEEDTTRDTSFLFGPVFIF